jgi:hypothetical protein
MQIPLLRLGKQPITATDKLQGQRKADKAENLN